MQYTISNNLSLEQANLLKSLEGATLNRIFLDDAGEFALSVFFDSSDNKLVVKNIPTTQSDGDEYPKLTVERAVIETQSYREVVVNKVIKNVLIIRDEASWQNNNSKWLIHSDIGIKIILEDRELVLLAHDSLAGLIKMIDLSETYPDQSELFEEYWSMKADMLESLKREEISL
ncbi:hypothetical protein [Pectinatus frisingensis]|uniref:hypothetical protein n=1 Tax=Pectinatus frisingensis TaxID=865 RepID=UPI003D804BEB